MTHHEQHEQLSALLDGELSHADRTALERHVETCAACRVTLAALRATVAEVRALPEPEPSARDSWALRAALARARASETRRSRAVIALGGIAAAVIAVVAITMQRPHPATEASRVADAANFGTLILIQDQGYDAKTAPDLLALTLARAAPATAGGGNTGGVANDSSLPGSVAGPGQPTSPDTYAAQISACERTIPARDGATATAYLVARYNATPAFFLIYEVAGNSPHAELWVFRRSDCSLLGFFQRAR